VALSNARDILRLPETCSGDDLSVAYRRAAKRVAPESVGTEGLLGAVNLARDVLKVDAF
jgi:curved DNA-binding protein CbpA